MTLALLLGLSKTILSDATVLAGGGPEFPLDVDSVYFFAWRDSGGRVDSIVKALPISVYAELRENIDSVFNYAASLRSQRRELSGCRRGRAFPSCISCYTMGTLSLKIQFACGDFGGGKVLTATDRYPFVVRFTKGFSAKLRRLCGVK
jgi:hypothetical protein